MVRFVCARLPVPYRAEGSGATEPRPVEISRHTRAGIKQHANIKEKGKEPMTDEKKWIHTQDLKAEEKKG